MSADHPADGAQASSRRTRIANAFNTMFDHSGEVLESSLNNTTAIVGAAETAVNVVIPFASFLPLITEVTKVFNEIIEIYQTAEHNKKICGIMLDRVQVADTAVRNLKNRREDNIKFFSDGNLFNLQKLVHVIGKIRKFVEEISQLKGLKKYIQAKSIEKHVKDLINEFDSTIRLLQFSLMVDFNVRADKDIQDIKSDIEDLDQYLNNIGSGLTDINKNVSEIVVQISTLNATVNQMAQSNSTDKSDVFQSELLEFNEFEEEGDPIEGQNVRKYKRSKAGLNYYVALKLAADKDSGIDDKNSIKNQVTILKKLQECECILQYFGLTADGDKFYLVTEWADYGNLREFYKTYGPLKVKRKLRFALDIARGLNFLRSIVHRDIRAENILITIHKAAKIANFKASRSVTDSTRNQKATLEAIRYCAPEKLLNGEKYKYDTKCEVYSFGILLWEIAEETTPYVKLGADIIAIQEYVCIKQCRESFSFGSPLPKEYIELAIQAVHYDHNFRPQFSKIFTILQDLCKPPPSPRMPPVTISFDVSECDRLSDDEGETIGPNSADFDFLTVDEAAKQHKLPKGQGKCESAYKCFEAYAELGDIKAKYMKGYYIQQKL
ncbi:19149_t:CDS:2, partial [Funneliformis geosporum]